MATLQELAAKKQSLIASGIPPSEAMAQAVTKPNIGGLSATQAQGIQDINKANLAKGMTAAQSKAAIQADPNFAKAKAQYNTNQPNIQASVTPASVNIGGTNPNTPQQPQVQAQTNLNAPLTSVGNTQAMSAPPVVEKTTTITPEGQTVVKKETPGTSPEQIAQIAETTKINRQNEVLANLNEGYNNDQAINKAIATGDYNTYKQAYGYDTADQTKKETLDAFFQARQAKDSEGIYQILKTGQKIANPAVSQSPDFARAQAKFNMFQKFNGMDANQLLTEMKNNNIGTDMSKELMMNPQYQLAQQKFRQYQDTKAINERNEALAGSVAGKTTTAVDASQKLSDSIVQSSGKTPEELGTYQAYLAKNNPELVTKVSELNAKNKSLKEMADARDAMYKTVIAEHPGISKGSALALAARLNEPLNEQIKSAAYELDQLSSDIKYQESIAREDYAYQTKQQELAQSRAFQAQQDERNFAQQKELATFQNALATESKKLDYAYQDSRDVQNFKQDLQKMGITDALQINRDKMNFDQQKEFAALQNKYQNSRDVQNYAQDINKLAFQYNNDPSNVAKNIENINKMPVSPMASQLLSIPDGESVPNTRSQCGQYVNDVLGTPSLFKDSIEDKMKVATDKEPQIGGAVVLSSTGKYSQYGHVGIVIGMDDKTITVKSSNRDGDGKISTDVLDRNYSRIKGYYNPTQKGAKTYNDNDIALLGAVEKLDVQGKKTLADNGYTEKDWANFKAGLLPPTENQKIQSKEIIKQIDDMLTGDALSDAVGTAKTPGFIPGTQRKDFEALFATFRDSLAMSNIDKLKGAMSDKDIEFLRNTASSLNLDMSEGEFKKRLGELKTKYNNILNKGQTTGTQSQTQTSNPKDVDAILNEWNTRNQ